MHKHTKKLVHSNILTDELSPKKAFCDFFSCLLAVNNVRISVRWLRFGENETFKTVRFLSRQLVNDVGM